MPIFIKTYYQNLILFCLLKDDDYAFTSDQLFFNNVVKPHIKLGTPFFMVVNQVDNIEPYRQWDEKRGFLASIS